MNREDTVKLCRYVKGACPQQAIDEFTPNIWHDLLGDLRLEDCRLAVTAVAQRQPFVSPSEIRAEVKRIRENRLGPGDGAPASPLPPPADPDDPRAYMDALRAQQKAIADGREQVPAIEGGGPTGYDDNPHVQRILAEFRQAQDAAARRKQQEADWERQQVRAYIGAVEQLLNQPDRGERALAQARDELYSDEQAAQGYPLLAATAGVMDEHKVTIRAAWLIADGAVA